VTNEDRIMQNVQKNAPPKVAYFVTSRCDSNCKFCWRPLVEKELDTEDSTRLISKVAIAGSKTLVFSGGEPTIRSDLVDLIEYASGLMGLETILSTNSHRLNETMLDRLNGKISMVEIPLDSQTPSKLMRGANHLYNAMRALKMLTAKNIAIQVNTLVTGLNKTEICQVGEILKQYPIKLWKIRKFLPRFDAAKSNGLYWVSDHVFEGIIEDTSTHFPDIPKVFVWKEHFSPSYPLIKPDGTLFIHRDTKEEILGNVLDLDLQKVWEGLPNKEHYKEIV
jgi:MoaA/NifB/PqqE/SkfB family radical SAM enzyme